MGQSLGFPWIPRNRNISQVHFDAQIDYVEEETMNNGVGRGRQREKDKGAREAVNDVAGQCNLLTL